MTIPPYQGRVDPVAEVLEAFISDLSYDAQIDLVAPMSLEPGTDSWHVLFALAGQENTQSIASCLRRTPLLADYPAAGPNALVLDCRDCNKENL